MHHISESVRCIRNSYIRQWIRWREDNADWEPEKGELLSSDAAKAIYRNLCDTYPSVATSIVACCMTRELKALSAKVPKNHAGRAKRQWQAILWNEVNPRNARPGIIPLHNQTIRICYDGDMTGPQRGPLGSQLAEFGSSSAVIALQLFSHASGKPTNDFCRLEARQLPAGKRKILRRLARGEWQARDSMLVFKEKEQAWFFQLAYKQPIESLGLDPSRVAMLRLEDKAGEQPFILTLGDDAPTWHLGFRILEREYNNIEGHRKNLRRKYRVAGSGRKGHGRARIEYRIRKVTHKGHDLMERFTDHVIADVLKFCIRHDCGTVDYEEPSLAARRRTWFAQRHIPYDWTNLLSKLSQKCTRHQLQLLVNGEAPG